MEKRKTNRMISCFIFDLDGVIVNTSTHHFHAWQQIANSLGIEFSENDNQKLKGISREDSLKTLLKIGNQIISDSEFKKLLELKNNIYLDLISGLDKNAILPSVTEKLNFLKSSGYKIALASSSKNAKTVLNQIGLNDYFDAVIDGNRVSKPKPNPEIFLTAAKLTNSTAQNCAVFEDSFAGICGVKDANMLAIGIGNKEILYNSDYVFENFGQISNQFLESL